MNMNMIRMNGTDLAKPMSDEERREIEAAEKAAPAFDSDSPEMHVEQLAQFRRVYGEDRTRPTVSIRLSRQTYNKAKSYGKGYTAFLGRLLDAAIQDEELVKRCV